MNTTVWKFGFQIDECVRLLMPKGAKVLSVGCQTGDPRHLEIWAQCDPRADKEERHFLVCGTGHDRPDIANQPFIGTVITAEGRLVWHVFEQL
jgi:hypothetical protein